MSSLLTRHRAKYSIWFWWGGALACTLAAYGIMVTCGNGWFNAPRDTFWLSALPAGVAVVYAYNALTHPDSGATREAVPA